MTTHRFALDREHIALNDLLKLVGLCDSGGAAKHLIAEGAVRVDGEVELRKTRKLRGGEVVEAEGVRVEVVAG